MEYPKELEYTKDHEWARREGELVRVGITAFAVEQLGDVTLVELPKVGRVLASHETFGVVESVKTVSDLFSPCAGEVVEVNTALTERPEDVNAEPYGKGWMVVIRPSTPPTDLLDAAAYTAYVGTLDH
ncbi:MAG: glycine cleavage system protein GcvH [Deltaproteobacteria bacterium]|nr:glycine cleavage system protein GcvH [Deltaproteobacteria bacterium]